MTPDLPDRALSDWRSELPMLTARLVTLREPTAADLRPLIDLRSISDATSFGIDEPSPERFLGRATPTPIRRCLVSP